MSIEVTVYLLTALAAVVVVLTRLRLGRAGGGAGRVEVGRGLLNLHTGAGALALLSWFGYLVTGEDAPLAAPTIGIVALAFWWVTVVAGLLILARWLPSRGRHASQDRGKAWLAGPGLSVLAHVGMLTGVSVFTYAYALALV